MNELTPIDFIAQMINQQKSRAEGYAGATLWLTLDDDLKKEYRKEAAELVENWKTDEREAQERRNQAFDKFK